MIYNHPLLFPSLVSLGFHGILLALIAPSFVKVLPEKPVSFGIAWVKPALPSCPPQKLPKKKSLALTKAVPSVTRTTSLPAPRVSPQPPLEKRGVPQTVLPAAHQPLPPYPWVCRKRGQEGIVCLHVHTNKDGQVVEASLHKSSGHARLDRAALEAVKSWILTERNVQKTLSIAFRLRGEPVSFS